MVMPELVSFGEVEGAENCAWHARSVGEGLWKQACKASTMALPKYSNFFVGSAIIAEGGNIYTGCNVEYVVHSALHGEDAAIAHMVMAGERHIRYVLSVARHPSRDSEPVLANSCGQCLQKMLEYSDKDTLVAVLDREGMFRFINIQDALPYGFAPQELME